MMNRVLLRTLGGAAAVALVLGAPAGDAAAAPRGAKAKAADVKMEYLQHRRVVRRSGNRGAAVAAGIALGAIGAAAIAASRQPAYAEPYYYPPATYGYAPATYGYAPAYGYDPGSAYAPAPQYYSYGYAPSANYYYGPEQGYVTGSVYGYGQGYSYGQGGPYYDPYAAQRQAARQQQRAHREAVRRQQYQAVRGGYSWGGPAGPYGGQGQGWQQRLNEDRNHALYNMR
jgi:hypothetical protein